MPHTRQPEKEGSFEAFIYVAAPRTVITIIEQRFIYSSLDAEFQDAG